MIKLDEDGCLNFCIPENGVCASCGRVVSEPQRKEAAPIRSAGTSDSVAENGGGPGVRLRKDTDVVPAQ